MVLVFDTETNGLPRVWTAPHTDTANWPRVIQLAYQLYDTRGELVKQFCGLIKPDGWVIPREKFWLDNGYSTEKNEAEGLPMREVLAEFISCINQTHVMVAHNLEFDKNILACEMVRYGMRATSKPAKFCTMKNTTAFCAIPNKNRGGFKWPKLEELHTKIFGHGFDNAHDALADVEATARCYCHHWGAKPSP